MDEGYGKILMITLIVVMGLLSILFVALTYFCKL